jgi:ribosomal-protein-alanine N-acetyltransferase
MSHIRCQTEHLDLQPLPAAAAAVLPDDRETAAAALGARLPPTWPQVDLLDVLPMQASAGPDAERYGIWVMIERRTNEVVGDIGFLGPPKEETVEIGFSVVPARRRRGFASEAARAILDWALGQPGIDRVLARCEAGNAGSIGVLTNVGFVRTTEVEGVIFWQATAS